MGFTLTDIRKLSIRMLFKFMNEYIKMMEKSEKTAKGKETRKATQNDIDNLLG